MPRVVNKPRLEPAQNNENSNKEYSSQNSQNMQEILSRTPEFENLKAFVENILSREDYEQILTDVVNTILKEEQMALSEDSKKQIRKQKQLMGMAFSNAVCYGDQQGLLYLLSDRLGYRRKY